MLAAYRWVVDALGLVGRFMMAAAGLLGSSSTSSKAVFDRSIQVGR
jgi:hypothetical protein